ncbi:hypothetical protein CDL12_13390 [Handroanthus impetiginosus]|uniref:Retrotransposon Copia-like N-terminal domain-containing protein n=1 Tax=Handroanthus impetiginosus TaxID=429701 RepID=A0A2G9H942_9LAMI|nr:hypothetical protein CDL12_13390 [Handroanthus impetiginosus]
MTKASEGSGFIKTHFLSNSPVITTVKLEGSNNYMSWAHLLSCGLWNKDRAASTKMDVQLCSLLWHFLHLKLLTLFKSCKTYSKDMAGYLGQVETLKDEFNSLMPLSESITTQEKERDKFFMVLALIGLRSYLSSIRDQILASPTISS